MTATKWDTFPLLAFDTETTGINTAEDRIVTAALVELRQGHRPRTWTYTVDPGIDIPAEATAVHGYTRDRAIAEATHTADQAVFEIVGRIALWLGKGFPLVAFNAAYDLSLLEHECHRHGIDGLVARLGRGKIQPVIDPHVLDKHASRRRGSRKLVDTAAHYGVVVPGAHGAAADAIAAARLFPRVMAKHPKAFPGMTVGALHQAQVKWRAEQMDSLRAYFNGRGIDHDGCPGEWPLSLAAQRLVPGVAA